MEWLILFMVSWIVFFILIDRGTLGKNIWCGIAAVVLQFAVDTQAISHQLYTVQQTIFKIKGSSIFFIFGPVIVIGTLLAQYLPRKRWANVLNIIVVAGLYSLQEYLLLKRGVLVYNNWHFSDSIVVNLSAMIILTWFAMVVLRKAGEAGE